MLSVRLCSQETSVKFLIWNNFTDSWEWTKYFLHGKLTTLTIFCLLLKVLTAEENTGCQHGLFFQDGQRHVDYILTYPVREPDRGRSNLQPEHRPNENDVTHSQGSQTQAGDHQLLQTHPSSFQSSLVADVEKGCPEETFSSPEDLKAARREEFEAKLRIMGLELERDEEVSFHLFL